MATLTLKRIRCTETEDYFGDEVHIIVHADTRRDVWQGDMDSGDTRNLGNIKVEFSGSTRIQLMEEDWPDADDDLGSVTVNVGDSAAVDYEGRFTQDDANYTIWYRVSTADTDEPEDGGECVCDPPEDDPDGEDPVCEDPPDSDDGAATCPMGTLSVHVAEPDGTNVQDAAVRVVELGLSGLTRADGTYDFGAVHEGDYTVEGSKEGKSPNPGSRAVHVNRSTSHVAELVLSDVIVRVTPTTDQKWYINETPNQGGHHGREVTIRAEVNPPTAGVRIHFTLVPGANNKAGLPADKRASISPESSLTNDSGIAETTLTLSQYGGDEFRVSAALNPGAAPGSDGTAQTGRLLVWKKLYFDVVEMRRPTGGGRYEWKAAIQSRVIAAFADSFIELRDTGQRHVGTHVRNFASPGAGFTWADGYTANNGVPLKVHFCVVDCAFPSSGTYGPTPTDVQENATGTPHVSTQKILAHEFNGVTPIISAQYQHGGSWTAFAAGKVTMAAGRGRRGFVANFSGSGVTPTPASPVPVKVRYNKAFGAGGWGGANALHLLICRGHYEDESNAHHLNGTPDGQIIVACIHEPGHALGLVNSPLAWRDAAHGSHCRFNGCTMWYQSSPGNERFHNEATGDPGCRTYLRGADLSRSVMSSKWNFPR